MSDVPELTEAEAAILRGWIASDPGCTIMSSLLRKNCIACIDDGSPGDGTDLGRKALNAYDARSRSLNRVAAMRECQFIAEAMAVDFDDGTSGLAAGRSIAKAISEKIAKEETRA